MAMTPELDCCALKASFLELKRLLLAERFAEKKLSRCPEESIMPRRAFIKLSDCMEARSALIARVSKPYCCALDPSTASIIKKAIKNCLQRWTIIISLVEQNCLGKNGNQR